jgi:hypothetical protein
MKKPGISMPELDMTHAPAQAQSILEIMQVWGMSRGHATKVCEHMLRLLGNSMYPWKDLRDANTVETANMLRAMAGSGELPK